MTTKKRALSRRKSGNVAAGQVRSAESRQCPRCERGGAMVRFSDEDAFGAQCRWPDCGYYRSTDRETMVRTEGP